MPGGRWQRDVHHPILWTMARENLDIAVVMFNNTKYSVLEMEFGRTGARGIKPGPNAASVLAIGGPDLDFVAIATGMGSAGVAGHHRRGIQRAVRGGDQGTGARA